MCATTSARHSSGFGAKGGHCAFFPFSGTTVADHATDVAGYNTSKGTIRFQPDAPLPDALVRKLVKACCRERAMTGLDPKVSEEVVRTFRPP